MKNSIPIGGMGETQFKLMCQTAGIVANPSITDAYGWDFNVEFPCPERSDSTRNLMLITSPIECKVQVKATRGKSKKVQVKLSNLKRMALYPMPCFFFFIEYNGVSPLKAYLLHLDRDWIEKILKKVTEATYGKKAKLNGLHKTNMIVRYNDCEELDLNNPQAIKQKIESFVKDGMENYVTKKLDLIDKLGFEKGAAEVSFKLNDMSGVEKLIDVTLGKESHVEVSEIIGHFKRFGINSDVPFIKVAEGTMSIRPNSKGREIRVLFKTYPNEPGVEFKAHLMSSPINHFVPGEYVKAKIYTDFFDIYIKPHAGILNISINCDSGKAVNILDLKKILKLWDILGSEQESVLMQLKAEGQILNSRISSNVNAGKNFEELKDACVKTIRVCNELDISLDLINTNFIELYHGHEDLKCMHMLLFEGEYRVDFNKTTTTGEEIPESEIAVLLFTKFTLGDLVVGAFFALIGEAKKLDGDRLEVKTNKAVKGPVVSASLYEKTDAQDLEDLLVGFEDSFSRKGIFTVRAN